MTIYTNHSKTRMTQRGITADMIELVLEFGDYIKDKVILNSKKIKKLIKCINCELKIKLLKILDKGGLVVVLGDDGVVITTYNCQK